MKEPQYDNVSDDILFALVRDRNDRDAFRVLYRRYSKRLYAYCLRVMGEREDARDVFQAAMVNLYEKRDRFSEGNFAGWLMTIVRNQCLMAQRKLKKEPMEMVEITTVAETLPLHDTAHDGDVLVSDALRTAIAQLPDEFREVITLKYFDDFSVAQIASVANISESLVKVRLLRARKKLLELMRPYWEELT